jgi:acyl carrier protein
MSRQQGAVAVLTHRQPEEEVLDTRERMRKFVVENFYVADPSELADDTSLILSGLVDSTGMLEVIAFLESEFGIRVGDQEMTPANLETLERIAAFVARKRAEPGHAA